MSFDIFFDPGRYGRQRVKQKNPFTGKVESVLPVEPLTPAERKAVRAVLRKASGGGPDEFGCSVVETADGGTAEVFGDDLANGCMVAVRGLTPGLLAFLIELLKAGNWVMTPAMEATVAITAVPERLKGLPKDHPEVVLCTSAAELGVLLADGFGAWKKYRDRVVRGDGQKGKGRGRKSKDG